ncbi:putative oxidoreductase, Gfo/Idh/MocA family [Chitinispirillum alkaliphilum]|nr:putative oxidoreductase, Gfo/Idh/MocA family [Chitinispirillum alkaliphilum]
MKTVKNLKVGIVGLGKMGQNHVRAISLLRSAQIEFIYDIDTRLALQIGKKYGVSVSTDLMKDLNNVDAVFLVSPTTTHFQYILSIGEKVKNIFIEKPLTDSAETTAQVMEFAKSRNLNIQVGFIERFNPAVIELKTILDNYGGVKNVEFVRTNKMSNRINDVDIVVDLMIHDIDLALYLNGPVCDIFAYGIFENEQIAYATAVLTHQNKSYSLLTASRITEKRFRQINVTCEEMYIDCNLLKKELSIHRQETGQPYRGSMLSSREDTIQVSNQEALLSEDALFIDSVLNNSFDHLEIATVKDAMSAITVANRIQEIIWGKHVSGSSPQSPKICVNAEILETPNTLEKV